jgi:hypothetical protein
VDNSFGQFFCVPTGLGYVAGRRGAAAARQLATEISIRVKVFLSNFALLYYVKKKIIIHSKN